MCVFEELEESLNLQMYGLGILTISVFLVWYLRRKQFVKNSTKLLPELSPITYLKAIITSRRRIRAAILELTFGVCSWFPKEGMYGIRLGPIKYLILFNLEAIEMVLKSRRILRKGKEYDYFWPLFRDGLITSTGHKWRLRRKQLTPTFHLWIDELLDVFNKQAKLLVENIDKLMKMETNIEIIGVIGLRTLDTAIETVAGRSIHFTEAQKEEYIKAGRKIAEIASKRICLPWLWNDFIFRRTEDGKTLQKLSDLLENLTRQEIEAHKQLMIERCASKGNDGIQHQSENNGKTKQNMCLLHLLLNQHLNDNSISLDEILEEVLTFITSSLDTSAIAISWAFYLLGRHPDIQRDVQQEIDMVLGDDIDKVVTKDDVTSLKYLHCVFKEALRLYPPVGLSVRRLEEDAKINEYTITKGTSIVIPTYVVHRNADYFPDPEKFIPDRFCEENSKNRHPFVYIPFSAGPRSCIGQRHATYQSLTFLATVLRHFNVASVEHRDKIELALEIPVVPKNGLALKFSKRQFLRSY